MNRYLAIDIGGSSIKYGLLALQGDSAVLESEGKLPIPDSLPGLANAVSQLADSYADAGLKGVAVSMPGLIDSEKGFAVHGGALRYIKSCDIQQILRGNMSLSLTVENDGKCAALGESWIGELKNVANGVVIVLGTGIGGGIISNGKLLRGSHLCAGEFSFIQTCNEGDLSTNSFSRQNGVTAFLKRYAEAGKIENIEGKEFFDLIENGEELAVRMFQDYCRKVAFQIINMQNILDPEKFVISGGISSRQIVTDMIADSVKKLRDEIINQNNFYFPEPVVVKSNLGNASNLYGAVKRFLTIQK